MVRGCPNIQLFDSTRQDVATPRVIYDNQRIVKKYYKVILSFIKGVRNNNKSSDHVNEVDRLITNRTNAGTT